MAPGLVEIPQAVLATASTKASVGPKEAFVGGPQVFDKTAEEQGTERHPPATHPNYLPVWDADTMYVHASFHYRLVSVRLAHFMPQIPASEAFHAS